MSDACVFCHRTVRRRQQAISCDVCDRWQHRTCNTEFQSVSDTMVNVKLNITGTIFEVNSDTFSDYHGKLPRMVSEAAKSGTTLTFHRPVANFAAIVEYYLTGELHMPNDVCPAKFKNEMEFWGIQETLLQGCCRIKFRSFLQEQSLLGAFKREIQSDMPTHDDIHVSTTRQRMWAVVDNRSKSTFSRVYFSVTLLAVITSILGITLGTDPCCMRKPTFCEMVDYVSFSNDEDVYFSITLLAVITSILGITLGTDPCCMRKPTFCEMVDYVSFSYEEVYQHFKGYVDISKCKTSVFYDDDDVILPPNVDIAEDSRNYLVRIYDPNKVPKNSTLPPTGVTKGGKTVPPPPPPGDGDYVEYKVRKIHLREEWIFIIEYLTIGFFTIDFIARVCSCPSLLQFAKSVLNVIDFAALIGSYLSIAISVIYRNQKYETNWIDMLDYIQVFRALRLFRLVKNIRTSRVLSFSIRRNTKDMSMLVIILMVFICTFGTLIYFAEDSSVALSILDGWWWSVVTLTTVGYGDIVPTTPIGRAIGSICAITGIWLLSMTLPIFVNDFVSLHKYPYYDDDDNANAGVDNKAYRPDFDEKIKEVNGDKERGSDATLSQIQPVYEVGHKNAWVSDTGQY